MLQCMVCANFEKLKRMSLLTLFGDVFRNFNSTQNYILLQLLINMTNLHILIFTPSQQEVPTHLWNHSGTCTYDHLLFVANKAALL